MTYTASDAALTWYNSSRRSKTFFVAWARERGVDLNDPARPGKLLSDWADIVMALNDLDTASAMMDFYAGRNGAKWTQYQYQRDAAKLYLYGSTSAPGALACAK